MPDPNQPRKYFDKDEENKLIDSISQYGLQQPILLRPIDHETYDFIIVHGERRFRAHQEMGAATIMALIQDIEESVVSDIQLIENVQRSALSDIELAWEFRRRVEEGQTHEEIAQVIGKERSYVTQRLRLLKLSETDQQRMLKGELGFSQARTLLSIKETKRREKVSTQINSKTTVKELKNIIQETSNAPNNVTRVTKQNSVSNLVRIKDLATYETIIGENETVLETVPRVELLSAFIKDLKQLRRVSDAYRE
jgi:ParB family chromosome partitioning protein